MSNDRDDGFNAHMIVVEYLPARARSKTKKESCTRATLEECLEEMNGRLAGCKGVIRGTTRQVHRRDEGNGIVWTNYPMFCPTHRDLTNDELNKINSNFNQRYKINA